MANRKINRVNTVLFDLDDTLLDSYSARIGALQDVFTRTKLTGLNAGKFLASLMGAPFQDALKRLEAEHNITEDLFHIYRHIYWIEQLNNIRLFPGIKVMLDKLKSRGYKLGVVTSKLRDSAFENTRIGCIYELNKVGILEMFSVIVGLEDVKRHKPHPDGINLALNKIDSLSQHTLFVGDAAADIEAAHSAGCRSCHAAWGIADGMSLPENLHPHYTIKEPRDVLTLDCL